MLNHKVRSRDIVNGIGAGLCLLDKSLRILWVNRYQSQWFGSPKVLYGQHCYKIFEHRKHICRGCPTLKVFKTGQIQKAKRKWVTKDGQKRYYQLTVSPIKNHQNKVIFALELVQDISASILQERNSVQIVRKLKNMYRHLSLANNRLRSSMLRIKNISRNMSNLQHKEELQDIFQVNRTINSNMDPKKISSLITRFTCELMHTDACILRLLDKDKKTLVVNASYSLSDKFLKKLSVLNAQECVCAKAIKIKKPLAIYNGNNGKNLKDHNQELIKKEGFRSMLFAPVILGGKTLGVISTFSRKPLRFTDEEMKLLNIFASQVAIALDESKHYEDIRLNYFNTIHTLVLAIEARDPYTRGHTERVTKYALKIGQALEMPKPELEILRYAGEVHDVGKISIPDFILNKPGRLTPAERAVIEIHPVKGVEMLEPLEFLKPALPVVRHHHERYDGTGYPDGLEKEKIPMMARIIACADAFDAMTSDRPYRRRKLAVEEALEEIRNNSGSQFDPHIAHIFAKTIQSNRPLFKLSPKLQHSTKP